MARKIEYDEGAVKDFRNSIGKRNAKFWTMWKGVSEELKTLEPSANRSGTANLDFGAIAGAITESFANSRKPNS